MWLNLRKCFTSAHLQKKVPNHSPEHYPPKEKEVIWLLLLKICAKLKKLSEIKPPLDQGRLIFRGKGKRNRKIAQILGMLDRNMDSNERQDLPKSSKWTPMSRFFGHMNFTTFTQVLWGHRFSRGNQFIRVIKIFLKLFKKSTCMYLCLSVWFDPVHLLHPVRLSHT